jgi:hypothetical protein
MPMKIIGKNLNLYDELTAADVGSFAFFVFDAI